MEGGGPRLKTRSYWFEAIRDPRCVEGWPNQYITNLKSLNYRYMIIGTKEQEYGTIELVGYVYFDNSRYRNSLEKKFDLFFHGTKNADDVINSIEKAYMIEYEDGQPPRRITKPLPKDKYELNKTC